MRFFVIFAMLAISVVARAAAATAPIDRPCRPEYVVPYTEQCTFGYRGIEKDRSPENLQNAFGACDRAQSVSVACVKSPTRQVHVVALNALYTAVSAQSEIAMFAGQYAIAESLLREKLTVIEAVGREAQPGDKGLESARASTQRDLADTLAGQCTWKALSTAGQQQQLVRSRRYGDLSTLLKKKADDYGACARLAATPQHRAYVQYLRSVALEEGGRAAQAAGRRDDANRLYRTCLDDTVRATPDAAPTVKGELGIVTTLCRGRMAGRYRVDQPEPIDADDGKHFKPLAVPTG